MNKKTKRFLQAVKQSGFSYNDIRRASLEILAEEDNTDEVRELIARGDPRELYNYFYDNCFTSDACFNIIRAFIKTGDSYWFFKFLTNIVDRDDVRQALIDAGDPEHLYRYLDEIEDRDDVRWALINTGDSEYLLKYLRTIDKHNGAVYEAFLDSDTDCVDEYL